MFQSILSLIANKDKLQCIADFLGVTPSREILCLRSELLHPKNSWATIPEFKTIGREVPRRRREMRIKALSVIWDQLLLAPSPMIQIKPWFSGPRSWRQMPENNNSYLFRARSVHPRYSYTVFENTAIMTTFCNNGCIVKYSRFPLCRK